MEYLVITVNNIEEWQSLNDTNSLGKVFRKAQSVLVGGGKIVLERVMASGAHDKFEEFTNLEDLDAYKKNVFKYLKED
ncbi:MAG TPA: hypothetical protein VGM31_21725 [Puia sp.]|jgi:hypothetical protein